MVLCDGNALNAGRVPGVMRGMVYWVGWLLHPCTLPNPAWLSTVSRAKSRKCLCFMGDKKQTPSQALPAHHTAVAGIVGAIPALKLLASRN